MKNEITRSSVAGRGRTIGAFFASALSVLTVSASDVIEVSPDGPLKTPAEAVLHVRHLRKSGRLPALQPVTIRIAQGLYELEGTLNLTAEDSRLTFEGAPGGKTVLSGGSRFSGFRADASGVWRCKIPSGSGFEELWVDGCRAVRARSPNSGYYYIKEAVSEGTDKNGNPEDWFHRAFVASRPSDLTPLCDLSDAELARVAAYVYYSWDGDWLRCERVLKDRGILVFGKPSRLDFFYVWNKYETRYHLENFRAALDAPGEWFHDRDANELLYIPRAGQNPDSAVIVAPRLRRLVRIAGTPGAPVRGIVFRNVVFSHTGRLMGDGIHGTQAGESLGAAVAVDHARGVSFLDCRFSHVAEYALGFRSDCRDCCAQMCCFYDLGAGGVQIGTTKWKPGSADDAVTRRVKVEDGVFLQGGRRFPGGVGIAVFQASDCTISHNDIADFYYTGVSVGWTWGYADTVTHRNLVSYNRIRGIGQGVLSDMGGIYTLGRSPGTRIIGNVIEDVVSYNYTGSGSCGIYTDEGSAGIVIESNLVSRIKNALVHQNYGRENLVRNNIFAFPDPEASGVCLSPGRREKPYAVAVTNNIFVWNGASRAYKQSPKAFAEGSYRCGKNLYWCYGKPVTNAFGGVDFATARALGADEGSLFADPLFTAPEKGDFTLKAGSPALRLGFTPFDTSLAGVRNPARREMVSAYRLPARKPIPVPKRHTFPTQSSTGFEFRGMGPLTALGRGFSLSGDGARSGRQSLKVTDIQGQNPAYYPHLFTHVKSESAVFTFRFSVRYEAGAGMVCDIRKWKNGVDGDFLTGPSLRVQGDRLCLRGAQPFALSAPGKWFDLAYTIHIKDGRDAVCEVTLTDPSGQKETVRRVQVDPGFDRPNWIGYVSVGTEEKSYWIDDFSYCGNKKTE